MKFKLKNVIILMVLSLSSANTARQCCPAGNFYTKKYSSCLEPITNKTTPISINCKSVVPLTRGFSINDDGGLMLLISNNTYRDVDTDFCIANGTLKKDVNYTRPFRVVVVCTGEDDKILDDKILGYCMIVSVVFLTLTAFIYASFSELRDLQGRSIINFCSSLAIGLAILVYMKLAAYSDMNFCAARGFFAYFFVMASFFWANAISIQILVSTRKPIVITDYGWRNFMWYAVYGWGCPLILTICVVVANYHPGEHRRPGIGLNHCWFFSNKEQWYYMFSIMSILLAVNIVIFIYTSSIIWRHKFSSRHLKAIRYKFAMTIRLIILMGLPWVFEMISSLSDKHIIWTILDIFNTFQGLLIFLLLVVFRKRVVKSMHKRGWLDCMSGLVERYLAVADDDEDVIQHTDLPMNDGKTVNENSKPLVC